MNEMAFRVKCQSVEWAFRVNQPEHGAEGVIETAKKFIEFLRDPEVEAVVETVIEEPSPVVPNLPSAASYADDYPDLFGSTESAPLLSQEELAVLFERASENTAAELESHLDLDKWQSI